MSVIWKFLQTISSNWGKHHDGRSAAALAYYSVFSMGPIIVIATAIASLFYGQDAINGEITRNLSDALGETGAQAVQSLLAGAKQSHEGFVASLVGFVTLAFGAIGVVMALKDALNSVWDAESPATSGVWQFVRSYVISLAGVLALGFMLLISLFLTTALAGLSKYWQAPAVVVTQIITSLVSVMVITSLFAMMFKWLPDVSIAWSDVIIGAITTALLFEIGKSAIGYYIGRQAFQSTFGAAASILVVLLWVYYTSLIVLLGAEITRAYAERHGSKRGDHV